MARRARAGSTEILWLAHWANCAHCCLFARCDKIHKQHQINYKNVIYSTLYTHTSTNFNLLERNIIVTVTLYCRHLETQLYCLLRANTIGADISQETTTVSTIFSQTRQTIIIWSPLLTESEFFPLICLLTTTAKHCRSTFTHIVAAISSHHFVKGHDSER